jgi:hypothetical protein
MRVEIVVVDISSSSSEWIASVLYPDTDEVTRVDMRRMAMYFCIV